MSGQSPDEALDRLVWDRVAQEAQQGLVVLDSGCWLHELERINVLGGRWPVRRTLWQSHHGSAVPRANNLVRRCHTSGCCNPEHLVSVARKELGRWLGTPGGAWRPAKVA